MNWMIWSGTKSFQEIIWIVCLRTERKEYTSAGNKNYIFYRSREKGLLLVFIEDNKLIFCSEIRHILKETGVWEYNQSEWSLFIDSSKIRLKCVLLNNGNYYDSILIGRSTKMKKEYQIIHLVLGEINYQKHRRMICVDLTMVNFFLGRQRQSGHINNRVFFLFS